MRALASVLMWGKGRDEHTARWRRNTYKMKDELLIMYRNEAYKQHKISRLYEIHVCVCVCVCVQASRFGARTSKKSAASLTVKRVEAELA